MPPTISLIPRRPASSIPPVETVDVLGVSIGVLNRHRLTAYLRECFESGLTGWMSYANVHALNLAYENPWFSLFLNNSLVTYCDGQGIRLGAALTGRSIPERIVMSDWIYDVCELAVQRNLRVYLLGSTPDSLEKALVNLKTWYPGLQIAGSHHGFSSDLESEALAQSISKLNVDLLIIGMGMPRQEQWILQHYDRLNTRIILNAGSCFDYVSGFKKRCPAWMGVMGLEWLFRLVHEPKRLWRRYLIGNPLFIFRIFSARFRSE